MTHLHDIMRLNETRLSNQHLADLALREDQAARRAAAAGRSEEAKVHRLRADELAGMLV